MDVMGRYLPKCGCITAEGPGRAIVLKLMVGGAKRSASEDYREHEGVQIRRRSVR